MPEYNMWHNILNVKMKSREDEKKRIAKHEKWVK